MTSTDEQAKKMISTIQSIDGTSEIVVTLQENNDATKPPTLLNISSRSLTTPGQDHTASERATHVIISLGSGGQLAEKFFTGVVHPILQSIYGEPGIQSIKVHTTTSATSILELTDNTLFPAANNGKSLRIILLSGDGGIVDLVNSLSAHTRSATYIRPEVVLLPLGTANALYHSINVGKQHVWGLDALASTTAKPLPLFTATFSPGARLLTNEGQDEEQLPQDSEGNGVLHGAVVASWGMHASLVADSDTKFYRQYGVERFKMAAKEALYPADGSPPHPYKAKLSVSKGKGVWSEFAEDEHMYVLATLVSNLEQPFCISPESKPLDGSLHIVHFGPRNGDEVMRIMGLAYQGGKHVQDEEVM
ncbi:LCB5 Sphingosine kinase and enzyme related to eukaryotic diacylglycerol kinase [Pyrenophora tritici-repentis]|nr:LCB5 Sphingosine kinase and enzyme to eukaryotic diacylglycerol kinase [Pyrenophora tritici-repentis]KAG9379711.1 LCB5 Sphingosine kinase and enzyme to eukaryotic diacylglycerol kinase [Pyrenophora tritici-repentis]KAI0576319.1 LCB5 Sphingosine kinase and enzyme related to eukaryotic diacylglycerol kinase [Pyrenophora tritici-repentis]KAI0609365.1 LCB5 Sphingosine kinase and enzyme related to eukaryotic diacylglycerol kinase [Pyrenophora tritici-repentis]KAI0624386.1 LCB5 Sphingosine kinase 